MGDADMMIEIPDDNTEIRLGSTITTGQVLHRLANAAFVSGFPVTDPVVINWDRLQQRDVATRSDAIEELAQKAELINRYYAIRVPVNHYGYPNGHVLLHDWLRSHITEPAHDRP